jgi:hypothetical protein
MRQHRPLLSDVLSARDAEEGFCLACGEWQGEVEPDARRMRCESCGRPEVCGAESLLLLDGFVEDDEGESDDE